MAHPGIETIGDSAFEGCKSIRVLDFGLCPVEPGIVFFPYRLEYIGERAFTYEKSSRAFKKECPFNKVYLKNITKLGKLAFGDLKLEIYPRRVVSRGEYEIETIGESCILTKYLGDREKVVIPEYLDGKRVIEIGESTFAGDENKCRSVTIPKSVKVIGHYAFANREKLKEVIAHPDIELIGRNAFDGVPLEILDFGMMNAQSGIVYFPPSLREIGDFAFLLSTGILGFNPKSSIKEARVSKETIVGLACFGKNTKLIRY